MRLYYVTVQNLVYVCGNFPQTTAESSDISPIHCAQLVQQSVDMSIQLTAGLQCDSVQMTKVGGAWLYPRVNIANNVHLSKHHSYCLHSQNRRRKDRPPERHLTADDHDK